MNLTNLSSMTRPILLYKFKEHFGSTHFNFTLINYYGLCFMAKQIPPHSFFISYSKVPLLHSTKSKTPYFSHLHQLFPSNTRNL